jgi:small multidrug resistance pump
MAWVILIAAIITEVAGTVAAKQAHGFTNFVASILMLLYYGLSLSGVTFAMKSIAMGIAYPVWTGSAILIVSILDVTLFYESMNVTKGFSIFFLVLGLVGLIMGGQPHS